MSWQASGYAKHIKECPNGEAIERAEKYLLLILADYHNTDTGYAWPSLKALAEDALYSERQIRDILHSLVRKGVLRTETTSYAAAGKSRVKYWFVELLAGYSPVTAAKTAAALSSRSAEQIWGAAAVFEKTAEVFDQNSGSAPERFVAEQIKEPTREPVLEPPGKKRVPRSVLEPIISAFRERGLPWRVRSETEEKRAVTLLARFTAAEIADYWKWIRTSGSEWEKSNLGFAMMDRNNRLENWVEAQKGVPNGTGNTAASANGRVSDLDKWG